MSIKAVAHMRSPVADVTIISTIIIGTKATYLAPARGTVNWLPGITIDWVDGHTVRQQKLCHLNVTIRGSNMQLKQLTIYTTV